MGLINLAAYCIAADRWKAAHGHAHEAVKVMTERQDHCYFLLALQHVAAVAALRPSDSERPAQSRRAARLLGYSDACFIRLGYSRPFNEQREYDRVLAALGKTFADTDVATHLADGATMNSDQAVELALSI